MYNKTILMYSMALVVTAGVSCSGEGAAGQEVSGTNRPAIICLNPLLDFGAVYEDAVVKHSYVLTNQGPRAVKLSGVRASCGCTSVTLAANELAPGQTTTIEAVINFKGRRGRQVKAIYAETDDPAAKFIRVEFTGVVVVPLESQPEGIHFGTVGAAERVEREVLITAVSNEPFKVLSARSTSDKISVSVETREAEKKYVVKVACDGPRKLGTFMGAVEVVTDHPRMPVLSIPVAGLVAGDIISSPATLLLIPSVTNEVKTAWFNLWSPAGKPFKITRVELPGEGMTNTVLAVRSDRTRLEIRTHGPLTGLDGKSIRVETDSVTVREVLIPLRVLSTVSEAVPNK